MHICRLLRNRVSAQQARERKKSYVSNLEQAAKGNEQQVMPTDTHHMYLLGLLCPASPCSCLECAMTIVHLLQAVLCVPSLWVCMRRLRTSRAVPAIFMSLHT